MTLALTHTPDMSRLTTLRLGGDALALAVVRGAAGLEELGRRLPELGGRPFALGFGSNLLPAGGEASLTLIQAANVSAPEFLPQPGGKTPGQTLVRVGAGFGLPRLIGLCQRAGLSGLEGLTGVPGRVGGAVAMNAGSYGVEIGSLVSRLRLWTPERGLFWREAAECSFGYRHFDAGLAGEGDAFILVWEAELLLSSDDPAAIRARMEAVYAKKKASQPVTAHSAGCVFKNPPSEQGSQSAGRLLDEAGMKGKRLGGMAFSPMHANFLVNEGGGSAAQALELLELGRAAVRGRFGVELQTEVVVLS